MGKKIRLAQELAALYLVIKNISTGHLINLFYLSFYPAKSLY